MSFLLCCSSLCFIIFFQNSVPIKKFWLQGTKTWPKNLRIKGRFWKDVHTQEGTQEYLDNHSYERQKCRQHLGPNMSLFLPQWHCISVLLQTFTQFSLSLLFSSSHSNLLFPKMAAPRPASTWPFSYSSQAHSQLCSWILSQITLFERGEWQLFFQSTVPWKQ